MAEPTNRVLVKLRPSNALRAAESRAKLRPLYETPVMTEGFGVDAGAQWYLAELPGGAASPWDLANSQIAGELGVAESDVVFAEPDIVHDVYVDTNEERTPEGFGATKIECVANPQDNKGGKVVGPRESWHLGDDFSQLRSASQAVPFAGRRTRIAHIDTGYYPTHVTRPANLRADLQRNFVDGGNPSSAVDPNNEQWFLDNSGHGTGTLSILASTQFGGAPDADVVPLRVADSVVLLRTSALARALDYAVKIECDVITMSMGGLPTQAWAEAVDRLYEAGIVYCAAGGNRTRPLPPSVLVYPARYPRVIAVVGVMANGKPYKNLDRVLEGCFGPDQAMAKALAAYTPNIPWARFGCDQIVRLNGEGTSSATPQVAAAAALWIEKNKSVLPRDWRRVEAVRKGLYDSAQKTDPAHFGNGVLRAKAALDIKPDLARPMSEKSKNSWAFLRLITGLGIVEPPPRERMFNLELSQRWMLNERLQQLVPDPDEIDDLEGDNLRRFMEAVIEDQGASLALRRHVASRYPVAAGGKSAPSNGDTIGVVPRETAACEAQPELRNPSHRRIRVYAVDPSLSTRLDTAAMNEVTLKVRWEKFEKPGPVGEYLEVQDEGFAPVDLDAPELLAQDGWAPSEGNPQFHQQMVYAVAMKTISHFEKALGRPVLWRHAPVDGKPYDDSQYVQRLAVLPHALRQANAFYSPAQVALLFGYFEAGASDPGEHMPGSRVYSCLSHDIIAHEITHAILDGMYRRFNEPTNPDVLAFHEAFADIIALLQHFTIAEVLVSEIARTRGDIEAESLLGKLAVQFGQASGARGALRNAIGTIDDGVWKRLVPDPAELQKRLTPHSRGAILVAAVFDAFIAIYNMRIADLLRIYTGGTGVLPTGSIHPDLVHRLADEAAKSANHVLTMCIRALDYLPPVDVTFFEYLRALITADFDLMTDERHNYRVAFVEAFRRRGIYPIDVGEPGRDTPRTLSVDTLRWRGTRSVSKFTAQEQAKIGEQYGAIVASLKKYADAAIYMDRKTLFDETRKQRIKLQAQLRKAFREVPAFATELGLDVDDPEETFEVHELRRHMHVTGDGRYVPHLIVVLTQSRRIEGLEGRPFRGGSTLVIDLSVPEVKYRIVKNLGSEDRQRRTSEFVRNAKADPLRAVFFAPEGNEPFSILHALADDGF